MLPSGLVGVIETLRGRMERHRAALSQSEALTRYALIDPLLRELGWDTADPDLVTPEYTVSGKRADYALLESGGVVVFLEAKRLEENLSNHRSQVVAYASELGIRYPALTNGNEWEVYDNSQLVPIEQRRILAVSLTGAPAAVNALQLLLLWRPNLASGEPVAAREPIVGMVEVVPAAAPPTITTPAETVVNPQPPVAGGGDWVDVLTYTPERLGSPKPTAIRFPGENEVPLQSWRGVLRETAEWLVRTGQLTADKCPVMRGTTTCVVNTTSQHTNGRDFTLSSTLSNGLYLNQRRGNFEVSQSVRALLRQLGITSDAVYIKLD